MLNKNPTGGAAPATAAGLVAVPMLALVQQYMSGLPKP